MRARAVYTPLRRGADFSRVHARGQRKGDAILQVRALPWPPTVAGETPIRLGILVRQRYGSAVERNRFKRLVRAALRELGPELAPGWDIVVLPREAHGVGTREVLASLRRMLRAVGALRGPAPEEGGEET